MGSTPFVLKGKPAKLFYQKDRLMSLARVHLFTGTYSLGSQEQLKNITPRKLVTFEVGDIARKTPNQLIAVEVIPSKDTKARNEKSAEIIMRHMAEDLSVILIDEEMTVNGLGDLTCELANCGYKIFPLLDWAPSKFEIMNRDL